MIRLLPLPLGFLIDLLVGDPHEIPHPVVWIGKLISCLESFLRRVFPKTPRGEKTAGVVMWFLVVLVSGGIPWAVLYICEKVSPWLRGFIETIMCWQILAVRSLRDESMKVYMDLEQGNLEQARQDVSMIVGRDTDQLDEKAVTRAAVETIAENSSDGIAAPLLYMALGGVPLGFFYKAANTMDSMVGYIDPPYTDFGWFPARMDDILNFIPARLTAFLMLFVGFCQKLDFRNGWKIFKRDRYKHASPNSAQTEAACAGLLDVQLAGDARYHGVLHQKPYIGDPIREIETKDIPRTCKLMYGTAFLMLLLSMGIRILI